MEAPPTIAIVGRPNVGKSTLFNRLIGKRRSIVAQEAGTTRDRIYQHFECQDFSTLLVDTGGLEYGKKENIEADIKSQAKIAIDEATLILLVLDVSEPLTKDDFEAADILRKSKKPVIMIANKSDNKSIEENIYNFYELGFGEAIALSAIHNLGIEVLEDKIAKELKKLKIKKSRKTKPVKPSIPNLCILGRPNAGKSSLFNALLGVPKVIVSEIAGTTRDSIDTEIEYQDKKYCIIDTAGLRRPGKISRGIEKFSSLRVIQSIESSDIALLVIDGTERISHQDCHIAHYALEAKKGLIIIVNKIDDFEEKSESMQKTLGILKRKFSFVPWAPVVFVSAKNKTNIYKILELTDEISKERLKRVPTAELNSFFQKIIHKHLPASAKFKKPKFLYVSQVEINPPTFTMFFNNGQNLHFSYPRYIENELRKQYGFVGTSITLKFKNKIRTKS